MVRKFILLFFFVSAPLNLSQSKEYKSSLGETDSLVLMVGKLKILHVDDDEYKTPSTQHVYIHFFSLSLSLCLHLRATFSYFADDDGINQEPRKIVGKPEFFLHSPTIFMDSVLKR